MRDINSMDPIYVLVLGLVPGTSHGGLYVIIRALTFQGHLTRLHMGLTTPV